jgi:hypothetical protein
MQLLSGPRLAELEQLPTDGYYIIDDHIGSGEEVDDCNILLELLSKPHTPYLSIEYVASDEYPLLSIPHYFLEQAITLDTEVPRVDWPEKTSAFSFSINKLRNNRRMMMEVLVREKLYTTTYSLGTPQFEGWPAQIYEHSTSKYNGWTIANGNFQNHDVYRELLYANVYAPSFIALITNAAWAGKSTFTDEKSVYAFDSGCIPIWVGGWKHPTAFREMGFDVFDDLVDHSYEALDNPVERIEQAIMLNKKLLQNKDLLNTYFNKNRHRFEANRNLIRSTKVAEIYTNKINNLHWPENYKQDLLEFIGL